MCNFSTNIFGGQGLFLGKLYEFKISANCNTKYKLFLIRTGIHYLENISL